MFVSQSLWDLLDQKAVTVVGIQTKADIPTSKGKRSMEWEEQKIWQKYWAGQSERKETGKLVMGQNIRQGKGC